MCVLRHKPKLHSCRCRNDQQRHDQTECHPVPWLLAYHLKTCLFFMVWLIYLTKKELKHQIGLTVLAFNMHKNEYNC